MLGTWSGTHGVVLHEGITSKQDLGVHLAEQRVLLLQVFPGSWD